MDAIRNGDYAEQIAITALKGAGLDVALPLGNQRNWDLLLRDEFGAWHRVQVKKVFMKSGRPAIELRRNKRGGKRPNYKQGSFEYLAAVTVEDAKVYMCPYEYVSGKGQLGLEFIKKCPELKIYEVGDVSRGVS